MWIALWALTTAAQQQQQMQQPVQVFQPPPPVGGLPPGAMQKQPQPQLDNFSLRGPQGAVTLKPGETKSITLTVDRPANFRGDVVITVRNDVLAPEQTKDVSVTPAEVTVRGAQTTATFSITLKAGAAAGERVVRFQARSPGGFDVTYDVPLKVVPAPAGPPPVPPKS
jgi:hypothetical protein